jgi:hypothetical protein
VLLLAAPLVCYAFGAWLERALLPAPPLEWAPALIFRRVTTGLLVAVWLAVLLAEIGAFDATVLLLLLGTAALLLALGIVVRRTDGLEAPWSALWPARRWGPRRDLAALALVLGLGAALAARPSEDVLGARDPGIYYATGVAIARDGALLQHDWALQALAADLGDVSVNYWLFQSVHGWPLRFPGQLFVRNLPLGQVEPGFLPWYPAAVAFAVDAGGLGAGLWANPVLATLALAAVFLAGRSLFGVGAGALCVGWLAINLAQVWFARYTMAEPAAQLLVWTGLYALVRARQRPDRALGVLAGLAWGGMCLTRVEAALLVPPVAGYLGWLTRQPRHRPWTLPALGLLAAGGLHAGWHAWRFAPAYSAMVFSGATLAVAAGGVALALTLAGALWLLLTGRGSPATRKTAGPQADRMARRGRAVLVTLLIIGAAFAYVVRPVLPLSLPAGEASDVEVAARESLVRLGWYVTAPGLGLALAGAGLLLWRGRWRRAGPFLGLLGLSLAFYLPNPLVSSDQPWAARRYLPLVLPGLLLLAAYAAVILGRLSARRVRWPRPIGVAVVALLAALVAVGEWQATAAVADSSEHAGALAQTEALAAFFPAEAIVLFPRSTAGMRLSLPLQYLGNRKCFVLPAEEPVEGVLEIMRRWRLEQRPIYWVVSSGTRFPTPAGFRFQPAGQFTFAVPQLERPQDRLPRATESLEFDLQIYRVELAP